MRILLIEDDAWHIEQAKNQLVGHELTICTSYKEAEEKFTGGGHWYKEGAEFPFDVVLTDLHLPLSPDGISVKAWCYGDGKEETIAVYGKEIPYGAVFAMVAMRRGVPVAIVSDGNHHGAPMNWAFDLMSGGNGPVSPLIGKHKFAYEEGKNWKRALERLVG